MLSRRIISYRAVRNARGRRSYARDCFHNQCSTQDPGQGFIRPVVQGLCGSPWRQVHGDRRRVSMTSCTSMKWYCRYASTKASSVAAWRASNTRSRRISGSGKLADGNGPTGVGFLAAAGFTCFPHSGMVKRVVAQSAVVNDWRSRR